MALQSCDDVGQPELRNVRSAVLLTKSRKSDSLDRHRALNDDGVGDWIPQLRPQRKLLSHSQIDPSGARVSSNADGVALRVLSPPRGLPEADGQESTVRPIPLNSC